MCWALGYISGAASTALPSPANLTVVVSSVADLTLNPGTALTGGSAAYSTLAAATATACKSSCSSDINCAGW